MDLVINVLHLLQLNGVAYEEGINVELERELFLGDAISDLPPVCQIVLIF